MKKIKIITILLSIFIQSCNTHVEVEKPKKEEKEEFKHFLHFFSSSEDFQKSRVIFPFLDCNPMGVCDSIMPSNWQMLSFTDEKTHTLNWVYFSLDEKVPETDDIIYSYEGDENNIAIFYYFKCINGKWFLIKRKSPDD